MGMDYRDADGNSAREFFDSLEKLETRKKELEAKGAKIERIVSVASVRRELHEDTSKYKPHQGQREIERRLDQLLRKVRS